MNMLLNIKVVLWWVVVLFGVPGALLCLKAVTDGAWGDPTALLHILIVVVALGALGIMSCLERIAAAQRAAESARRVEPPSS